MRRAERRRRSNSRSRRRSGQSGFSLVEIVIAILLAAVMMASVMSASITAKTSGGKIERRVVAGMASSQLSARLSNFITAYWDYSAGGWIAGITDIGGPAGGTGQASWAWAAPVTDGASCGAPPCYALQAGAHPLTNFLPAWFEAAPYNARISYTVTAPGGGGTSMPGGYSPLVSIAVNWTEP